MTQREGYDPETYEYVGPCPDCGTNHGGHSGPETLGGALRCLEARAAAAGDPDLADRVAMLHDYARVSTANALGLPFS